MPAHRRGVLCATILAALAAVGLPASLLAPTAMANSTTSQESVAVRAELSRVSSATAGPVVSDSGGRGGTGAAPSGGGTLIEKDTTANSDTYLLPNGHMLTRSYTTAVNEKTSSGKWRARTESKNSSSQAGAKPLFEGFPNEIQNICTLASNTPTTSACNAASFSTGYESSSKATRRSLLQFGVPFTYGDTIVMSAKVGLYEASSTTTSAAAMGVYRVTTPWTTSATWNTSNGSTAWHTAGGDYANPEKESDAAINPSVGAAAGWAYWYPTKMVQEWYNGTNAPNGQGQADIGLLLKDVTEGATNNVVTFEGAESKSHHPVLEVEWAARGVGDSSQYTTISTPLSEQMSLNVNVASGNLAIQNKDLEITGRGLNFESTRTLNSKAEYGGSLVPEEPVEGISFAGGWTESNASRLIKYADGSVDYADGQGGNFPFIKSGVNYLTPPGINATMCAEGSQPPCPTTLPTHAAYELLLNPSQTHLDFNTGGRVIAVEDRYGNTLSAGYTGGIESPTSWKDTEGRNITYTATATKGYSKITDESGKRSTKYTYESDENKGYRLAKYEDADGATTTYHYGTEQERDQVTQITTPAGRVVKLYYDGQRRVTKIIRTTNAEHTTGPTTTFTYYAVGTAPAPCTAAQIATVVTDPDGNEGKEGHTTTYCANVIDEVEKTIDAAGNEASSTYNPFGEQTSTTAASPGNGQSGNVTNLGYDEFGRNLLCIVQGGSAGQSSCPSSPGKTALVTSFNYKDATSPTASTRTENPEANSEYSCFNAGVYEHEEGAPTCPKASETTGPANSLESRFDSLSTERETKFEHNSNGTIKSSTDPRGETTSYEYDSEGNLKEVKPPVPLSPTVITVDADSRPHTVTDGAGHIETITYDKDDRVTQIADTGTGTAKTINYEYDADGNIKKREDSTGTTKYTVDALNRITKEELPGSLSNSYEYDAASNTTSFTDGGGTTTYKYNKLNELEAMREPGETKETTFAYDNDHRLTKITYPSGVSENYKLEASTGRPETVTAEGTTGLTVPKFTYTYKEGEYNTALLHTAAESTGNTTTYTYDPLERLTGATTTGTSPSRYAFKLDGDGNRTWQDVNPTGSTGGEETDYTYNAANELECRQTVSGACTGSNTTELSGYEYDHAGEETAIVAKGDTSGTTFAFNAANELASITPSGSGAQALAYGGSGQDDLSALGSTTIQNSLLGQTREVSSAGTSYYARTSDGLLIDQRTPSGKFNPLYDGQGDVVALVSSTGKVERTFRYGPDGENVKSEGTQTIPDPFGFKGGYRVPGGNIGKGNVANGLYHFGQRYYDPTTGRWNQQDPLDKFLSPGSGDRFVFAGADALNESDPSGLSVEQYAEDCGEGAIEGAVDDGVSGAVTGCVVSAGIRGAAELFSESEEEEEEDIEEGEVIDEVFG